MASDPTRNYGSIEDSKVDGSDDVGFDEESAYYLKSTDPASVRLRRVVRGSIPIMIAILIIGGAAYFLTKDFSFLYPGANGARHQEYPANIEVTSYNAARHHGEYDGIRGPRPTLNSISSQSGEAACSAHEGCSMLVGNCCPSDDGTNLDCCSN